MLEVRHLSKTFPNGLLGRQVTRAVRDVSFTVDKGTTLGLAGSSGCGKSTIARLILRLIEPDGGSVRLDGVELTALRGRELRPYRAQIQLITQHPESAMDPSRRIYYTMEEPLKIFRRGDRDARREQIRRAFDLVGVSEGLFSRYPHEISGGEAQRIAIARALLLEPRVLILDEPTSMLDVSIQAHIMTLLRELQEKLGLTYLFISHDIEVIGWFCDRVAVMRQGEIVEQGETRRLLEHPEHPFTRDLVEQFMSF